MVIKERGIFVLLMLQIWFRVQLVGFIGLQI